MGAVVFVDCGDERRQWRDVVAQDVRQVRLGVDIGIRRPSEHVTLVVDADQHDAADGIRHPGDGLAEAVVRRLLALDEVRFADPDQIVKLGGGQATDVERTEIVHRTGVGHLTDPCYADERRTAVTLR